MVDFDGRVGFGCQVAGARWCGLGGDRAISAIKRGKLGRHTVVFGLKNLEPKIYNGAGSWLLKNRATSGYRLLHRVVISVELL